MTDIVTSQCFVEGTLIVTNEGDKPIEEIQAGDLVYSTNPETGESEYKEVLRTFRKESDVIIHIFVNGEEIETTPVHPFWVEDQWVAAKDLEVGDILTLADGSTAPVTYTYGEKLDEPVIVYNFEVSEFHTYYVTDTGVLVHNQQKALNCGITTSNSKQPDTKSDETEVIMCKKPHKNGTKGHWETILDKVEKMKKTGDYSKIYVNKGIRNEIPGAAHNNRPDIMGVRKKDGLIDQFEVPSKTDSIAALRNRMNTNKTMMGSRAGSTDILPIPSL